MVKEKPGGRTGGGDIAFLAAAAAYAGLRFPSASYFLGLPLFFFPATLPMAEMAEPSPEADEPG